MLCNQFSISVDVFVQPSKVVAAVSEQLKHCQHFIDLVVVLLPETHRHWGTSSLLFWHYIVGDWNDIQPVASLGS